MDPISDMQQFLSLPTCAFRVGPSLLSGGRVLGSPTVRKYGDDANMPLLVGGPGSEL